MYLSRRSFITFLFVLGALTAFAQSVTVMTYNIRYDNPGDGINQWSSRKEKVYDLIRKYDPDLLGVQEAMHNQLQDLTNNVTAYGSLGVGREDGKEKGEYSAILYKKERFNILAQGTFWLSETPDVAGSKSWDAALTRVATWARMRDKKSGREFFFINTHFDHIGRESRTKSATLLKTKALDLGRGLPVVITGDFNCTRDELPYKTIMDKSSLTLIDPAPQDPPGTFCSFTVNSITCRPIDYIFHTPEWAASNYKVLPDNDGKNYPSDHLPVLVELSLPKK
ncbi:endonuclease/exonuclease/phosphatase family protein [Fulvivirgaceae bacterium PWU4]|uniref:Endonuclease/exonuclease/phosphatase family protein n=1 Tax=Chryseosolibacter histidini TaxID=2782349 RepID=A0AAP2DRE0_9BACT|nr:endonuclease/exonuclease/phosphatase family protein [Chryseosolibacter histidini]MBT1701160.1 endonuclease/exonuclease/phosphatase family protein [Chryseosolibacter histidini]